MTTPTLFSRFLAALGVPHTVEYSDRRFRSMPFSSLFGLSHLLSAYGIDNQGYRITDKSELSSIPTPFLAQMQDGVFAIVTSISPTSVTYDLKGQTLTSPLATFLAQWNGIVLLAWPKPTAKEPNYAAHHTKEVVQRLCVPAMVVGALFIVAYFFIENGLYRHLSAILLTLFNCLGLFFSYLLMQKTLGIKSATGNRVCGIIQEGGCDTIVNMKVSKLFGVFAWSEVGFAYFGVSLAVLLLFPQMWGALAVANVFCLPYSFWSVWYQKYRARHWCTLCLGVQTTLWLLFFAFLWGGWFREGFTHLRLSTLVLIAVYATTAVAINTFTRILTNLPARNETDSTSNP